LATLRILDDDEQQQQERTALAEESLQLFTNLHIHTDASALLSKTVGGGWSVAELPKEAGWR
jgi:hypothetical protein